ncbi:DUF5777 family beta-barrel protein [Polaribacter septentrionalilitoris]|uniref:DUF5777 family beta-barrel protein n=1 Tax=Polaribacter septentrionalilitoris TaxID=2494657 RepID=UPI001F1ECD32|nr:DUF5777 family beta-barrel protein [Polaribacter septentrionalilitoris]
MMNSKHFFLILTCIFFVDFNANAQDLLKKLDKEFTNIPLYEIATFKTTRIGLGQSIETRKKGALEISLYNRYWDKPNTQSQSFLADEVNTRYGLAFSFSDNFTIGFGYSNFDKISDGYLKYRIIRQRINSKKMPISITLVQNFSHRKFKNTNANLYSPNSSENRYAFSTQALIARKFSPELSLQVAPTFIHRATPNSSNDSKSQFAIGFGGRQKIGAHTSIVSEYFYVANTIKSMGTFNSFLVGINWEVSDLMLQFHLTNARNFAEDTFISQTTNNFNFKDPNLHFGFNATFILHTKKKKINKD